MCCRALVPTMHMSDSGAERAKAKYKEGQKVSGRVLEVDVAVRKITLSLKKLLVGEKLPPFASWQVIWHCTSCGTFEAVASS
jgi:ribosomal protein S1